MRLWSIHPQYLDPQGLVSVWREGLLAQAVLRGKTRGYRNHPQLDRFRNHTMPLVAISNYLSAIYQESLERGYSFDRRKIRIARKKVSIPVTSGQIDFEWAHLMAKIRIRSPEVYLKFRATKTPRPHPMFLIRTGPVEPWERPGTTLPKRKPKK